MPNLNQFMKDRYTSSNLAKSKTPYPDVEPFPPADAPGEYCVGGELHHKLDFWA